MNKWKWIKVKIICRKFFQFCFVHRNNCRGPNKFVAYALVQIFHFQYSFTMQCIQSSLGRCKKKNSFKFHCHASIRFFPSQPLPLLRKHRFVYMCVKCNWMLYFVCKARNMIFILFARIENRQMNEKYTHQSFDVDW